MIFLGEADGELAKIRESFLPLRRPFVLAFWLIVGIGKGAAIVRHVIAGGRGGGGYDGNDVKAVGARLVVIEKIHVVAGCEDEIVAFLTIDG